MQQWMIDDARTRFCTSAMRLNGGTWDDEAGVWAFRSQAAAANALVDLYRASRATISQREVLAEMIADGTGNIAWERDTDALDTSWLRRLDRAEASRLIEGGIAARRVLGYRMAEDRPAPIDDDRFDTEAFERGVAAGRARLARSGQ